MNQSKDFQVVLDPSGENSSREGFTVVETELGFLRLDGKQEHIWIRGHSLCNWVRDLYRARGLKEEIDYQLLPSPRTRLHPFLGERVNEVNALTVQLAIAWLDKEPNLKLNELLSHLTEDDFWVEPPSLVHAARWLMAKFDQTLNPFVEVLKQIWKQDCIRGSLQYFYEIELAERNQILEKWLFPDEFDKLGVFPVQVEGAAVKLLKDGWGKMLRETQGAAIEQLSAKDPNAEFIAEAAYEYFSHQAKSLSSERLARISPFLPPSSRGHLEMKMPRVCPQPIASEATVEAVLDWAVKQYLPYREWQVRVAENEEERVEKLGDSFADWLLDNYPKLTAGSRENSYLNVRGRYVVEELAKQRPVFWIVVDGLNYLNHQRLLRLLAKTESALGIEQDSTLLAVLPTVTKQAKYALTSGDFPSENDKGEWDIKKVFQANFPKGKYAWKPQIDRLRSALSDSKASVCYWNMTAIDECYHEQTDPHGAIENVEAHLNALAKNISALVMTSAAPDQLAIVISTDHGQMLGYCMKSDLSREFTHPHGRTAYTSLLKDTDIQDKMFVKIGDGLAVELNQILFKLDAPTTLALGRFYFGGWSVDSQGRAWGVHGGLFPEEVVVGFSVLSRKPIRQPISARVEGEGETGKQAKIILKIDNPNPASIRIISLIINELEDYKNGKMILESLHSVSNSTIELFVQKFPAPNNSNSLIIRGNLLYEFEDGQSHECEVKGNLICKQMYSRQRPSLRDKIKK